MEYFQAVYKCAILLALVACHEVFVGEGRQMKSTQQNQYTQTQSVEQFLVRKKEIFPPMIPDYIFSLRHSDVVYKDDFRPSAPGDSRGVGYSFPRHEADVEPKALGKSKSPDTKHSFTGLKHDYPPTAPGHSPGVGHAFPRHKANDAELKEVGKSGGFRHSLTGFTPDARPTAPGHSPGVGHVLQNKHAGPNA